MVDAFLDVGFALRFAASYPSNAMVLSGTSDYSQMQENISSMADSTSLMVE